MENQKSQEAGNVRRRYSREEKRQHIEDQASSGLSGAAYCREHGLRYGNFLNWQRQGVKASKSFRPIELVSGSESHSVAEIRFSDGKILLIREGCTEQMARGLVKVLS